MSTERLHTARSQTRGFTTIELVVVMVLIGILAVFGLPKLTAAITMVDESWRDQVLSAMRFAQKGAVARRRLTCVTVSTTAITITTASVNNGSSSTCNTAVAAPDGSATFASTSNASAATAVSPSGVLYFQPDGTVTTDSAGTTPGTFTISMSNASSITINGWTGYVQ